MALTDPLGTIIDILTHASTGLGTTTYPIVKDDGSTQCTILVTYGLSKEKLTSLFGGTQDKDVVITVEAGEARSEWIGTDTVAQITPIILTVHVIEKHSATGSGNKVITPELVRWKAKDSILKRIKAGVNAPGGSISMWKATTDYTEEDIDIRPVIYKYIVETECYLFR